MDKIKFTSRIPALMQAKGIRLIDIVRAGISGDTARRLKSGHLNVSVATLMKLIPLFGVDDIGDFAIVEKVQDEN